MKKVISLLYFLFFIQTYFSQQREIDSLELQISKITNDSLKNLELIKISKNYRRGNSKIQKYFIDKAIKTSNIVDDEIYKADAIRELSIYYGGIKKLDSALIICNQAIALYAKNNDAYAVCIAKNDKANILNNQGDYLNAIKYYKEVISYLESLGPDKELNVLFTKMNIGGLYSDINEYDKSIAINLEVYNNLVTKKNPRLLSSICINLSLGYKNKKQLDEALKYALESEKIETRPRSLANVKRSLANIYSDKKEHEKAHRYYKEVAAIYKSNNLEDGVFTTNHNMAYNLLEWGKYNEAEKYFLMANKGIENSQEVITKQKSYQGLSELYYVKKNYKKALEYYKKERELNDSLSGIEKQKAIKDFEVKYETEKTQREKELAEKQVAISQLESQKNKNLFLGTLIITGLLLLLSLIYFSRLKAKRKAEFIKIELKETQKRLAIEKQYRDSELKALKAQMNPHFIFNALNSIQDYIVLNKKNLASDYLGKFADLIRNYLHFSDTGFISVSEEVHNLNLYLELEKLRFEEQLHYSFKVDTQANSDTINIPTMLIQPYVENALKHGLLHKKDNRKLQISITKASDKIIECSIEDNGIGREKSKEINKKREGQHKSFALKATTERLDLLNYGREKKIGVEIIDLYDQNKATGTKVILKIPIIKK
ncbi:tetratricopeptide repeat-containing sensor histidine kinase [Polaribacter sp.]|uniref:tetratricopeptide repeat-containing sensor histidine kinase n=1 Tax=Polaribacter sp. TaxID=1920175 RepID=UPI003EF205C8